MLFRRKNPYLDHPLSAPRAFFLATTLLFLLAKIAGLIAFASSAAPELPPPALSLWTGIAAAAAAVSGYITFYLLCERWDRLRLFPWAILIDPSANLAVSLLLLPSVFLQDRGDLDLLVVAALAVVGAALQLILACYYSLDFHSGAGNVRSFPLVWQDWPTERLSRRTPAAARQGPAPPVRPTPLTCSATCNPHSSSESASA